MVMVDAADPRCTRCSAAKCQAFDPSKVFEVPSKLLDAEKIKRHCCL